MKRRAQIIWICCWMVISCGGQTVSIKPSDHQVISFNYHHYFCDTAATAGNYRNQAPVRLKFRKFDMIKYYASNLSNQGQVSYYDPASKLLNHLCDSLKTRSPLFNFHIAMVKQSKPGFLSVSKDYIYLSIGTLAKLNSQTQIINLLYILAYNHANKENYQPTHLRVTKSTAGVYDEVVLGNQINAVDFDMASHVFQNAASEDASITLNLFLESEKPEVDSSFFRDAQQSRYSSDYPQQPEITDPNYILKLCKFTQCHLLYVEGKYAESIWSCQELLNQYHSLFLHRMILQNIYLMAYHELYGNNRKYENVFDPTKSIARDKLYFIKAIRYFWYIYQETNDEIIENLLNQLIVLQKISDAPISSWNNLKPAPNLDSLLWFAGVDPNSHETAKKQLMAFNNYLAASKASLVFNVSKMRGSIVYISQINDSTIKGKNQDLKNAILVLPPTVEYKSSIGSVFTYEDYYFLEKRKYSKLIPMMNKRIDLYIKNSLHQSAYTRNILKLGHTDVYMTPHNLDNDLIHLKPNIDLQELDDSVQHAMGLRYIVYVRMKLYLTDQPPRWRNFLRNTFLTKYTESNQVLLIADVYDVKEKKYIIACRRLLETRGTDIVNANWYDIFKTILP